MWRKSLGLVRRTSCDAQVLNDRHEDLFTVGKGVLCAEYRDHELRITTNYEAQVWH